jgi:hypothetical protein
MYAALRWHRIGHELKSIPSVGANKNSMCGQHFVEEQRYCPKVLWSMVHADGNHWLRPPKHFDSTVECSEFVPFDVELQKCWKLTSS